jgi:hypothetical protein
VNDPITFRHSTPDDRAAILRLEALEGRAAPAGGALLAFAAGELRAAVSLVDGAVLADPFHRTAELVELLRLHGAQEQDRARPCGRPLPMRLALGGC